MKRIIGMAILLVGSIGHSWGGHEAEERMGSVTQAVGAVVGAAGREVFDAAERAVLADYLGREGYAAGGKKPKHLPPGLRKKLERGGELPPGWQAKVARGEVIDLQVYGHAQSLPEDILARLRRGPEGTSVHRIDDRIVRIADATRTVLDVFYLGAGHY